MEDEPKDFLAGMKAARAVYEKTCVTKQGKVEMLDRDMFLMIASSVDMELGRESDQSKAIKAFNYFDVTDKQCVSE